MVTDYEEYRRYYFTQIDRVGQKTGEPVGRHHSLNGVDPVQDFTNTMEQNQDAEGQSQNKLASAIQLIRSHIVVHGSAPGFGENAIIDYVGKSNELRLPGRPKNGVGTDPVSINIKQAATDAGLSERQRKTAIRVANVPEDEFEEYVEGRWDIAKSRAHQLIEASDAATKMSTIVEVLPSRESHVREWQRPGWRRRSGTSKHPSGGKNETLKAAGISTSTANRDTR